jgi:cytochrome c biogenesis protein CcmG/thiol:disulfide interchange protein DsbE
VAERDSPAEAGSAYRPPSPAPTPVDSKVNELSVRMLDGGEAKFVDLIGNNKVVLINFWATWCPPCRIEIPELVALQRDFKEKGVEVIGLTVEDHGMLEGVKAFVEREEINYRVGFAPEEMFMLFNGSDPRSVIPQTFIFDRSGKLVDRVKGFRRDFRNRVEGALNHALNNS